MGRWLFILAIVIALQVMTWLAVRVIRWWAGELLKQRTARLLLIGMLLFGNVLFLLGVARINAWGIKISMAWMSLLWLFIMSSALVFILNWLVILLAPKFAATPFYKAKGVKTLLPLTMMVMVGTAIYNAYIPVIRHITITTNQPLVKPLRIGMASDFHLGFFVGNRELNNLEQIVKDQKIELLLLPGDILDDTVTVYNQRQMGSTMQRLVNTTPMGVYASLGNHDFYGNEKKIIKALRAAGVTVLTDQTVAIEDKLWVIGRLDNHAPKRMETKDLMPSTLDKPVILLDHEPNEIEKNVQLPIDVQLSGHTHNRQIFPANFIVHFANRLGYGHERINNTDVIVSSGYGFWGMPFRLGSQSEVWVIDLLGKPASQ